MTDECSGEDHRFQTYAASDRRLLALVESFNRRLVAATGRGADLSKVLAILDPDPARYTWVDEGAGAVEGVLAEAEEQLASAPGLPGFRLLRSSALPTSRPAARPSVARSPDSVLVAWIEWDEVEGERVMVATLDRSLELTSEPQAVSGPPGDCLRPSVVFDGAGTPWAFFGLRRDGEVGVFCSKLSGGRWTEAELFSTTPHPSFNQEAACHADGSIECCWQGYLGGRFGIFARRQAGGGFGEPRLLSGEDERNVWDPAIVTHADGSAGHAWTTYGAGGYQTAVRLRRQGEGEASQRLSADGAYSLHPSLAFGADGSLWCAYDSVALGGHAGSGPTRLRTRAEMGLPGLTGARPDGRAVPGDLAPDVKAEVVVVRIGDDPASVEETGPVGGGAQVSPAGLPRLAALAPQAAAPDGTVAVAYRCLRRLPLMLYYWDTVVEWHGPSGWGHLTTFERADGPLEEPALASNGGEAVICWQEDGRRERQLAWTEGFGGQECARRREHYGEVVWHGVHTGGRIRASLVPGPDADSGADSTSGGGRATRLPPPASPPRESRPWALPRRDARPGRYQTRAGGRSYQLYWGDLHRHSLISRCTAGDEPELDDFYRYAFDVCEYDFWAVTDHSENTSAYQWWQIQKLADVLHVPGRFVPLYGFEWTAATGHQNVVYESTRRGAPIYSSTAEATSRPDQLWEQLRSAGQRSLTIPHHPGSAMVPFDWSYHDDKMLRLVEVFQACRGNYEEDGCFRQYADATRGGTFVADGLRSGHRFGLIASSDHGNGASYVGAFAEELSREGIFSALSDRRTIAATTRDIAVDFRVNDSFMGTGAPPSSHAALSCLVRGYRDIARLDIVRNGAVSHTIAPPLPVGGGSIAVPVRVEWATGATPRTDWSGRLEVDRGRVLETEFWSPEIVDVGPRFAAWSAETRNFRSQYGAQRGGVELTLVGPPETVVRVATAALSGDASLGQLAAARSVELARSDEGTLSLRRGTGGLTSLGASELAASFEDRVPEPSFYYARVILEDGEMAWSSPIWIAPPDQVVV